MKGTVIIMLKKVMMMIIDIIVSTIAFILLVGIFFLSGAALLAWETDSWIRVFMWVCNIGSIVALTAICFGEFDNLEEEETEDEELT